MRLAMIMLFGGGQSRSFRALWALEESGLKYDYKPVRIGRSGTDGTQTEEYKQLNSQGKVPSLKHDDCVINESAAILNYIAELSPDRHLMPLNDIKLRAYYDEICSFVITDLEQPLWTNTKHSFVLPKEHRVVQTIETSHWEFSKSLHALEFYLDGVDFVINHTFTMADILIAHTLQWAEMAKFKIPQHFLDYKNRMYARSSCADALEVII